MDVTGIIFASIDTDAAAIESWNRWYDLEHLPPNVALPGIMSGRRYVATPELHDARMPEHPIEGFESGKGVHLTIYTLCREPAAVIADMTLYRDRLEAAGRMEGAGNRVVRMGDAMTWEWGLADPVLRADPQDLPHIGHEAVRVVLRRGGDDAARTFVARAAVGVDGVHAVLGYAAVFQQGVDCDLYLLEGDPVAVVDALRAEAAYPDDAEILLDAAFRVIVPFDYSFADAIRASWLPQTIDEP